MVDRKVVPFDEFYCQLKLMHLFLLHPVYLNVQISGAVYKLLSYLFLLNTNFKRQYILIFGSIQGAQ
jgi:hypothetical protein